MSTPDQLGDGDRKIPLAERSRLRIGNILYEFLTAIRRKEGVDPAKYPPIAADIQFAIRCIMYGAEMAARETADLLLPAILAGHAPRRFPRTRALLRHQLTSAAIIIAAGVIYMDSRTFEKPSVRQEYQRVVGQAILDAKPEIVTSMGSKELTITISGDLLDGTAATLLLKHGLSEEDFQRLRQDLKK